jgi:dTDP-4-dehydrorhamnose 3,5-epimerase
MKYTPTDVTGVTIVDTDPHRDCRGFFPCWFGANDFVECGDFTVAQTDVAFRLHPGRFVQSAPSNTAAAVEVRPKSQTYRRHASGTGRRSGAKP